MTLEEIFPATDLAALGRRRASPYDFQSVHPSLAPDLVANGWEPIRSSRSRVRLRKPKSAHVHFEDRVWCLLYRMGFTHLSGIRGAVLIGTAGSGTVTNQLDVVALDDEVLCDSR
jgi:DNA sulfur modification protein DndB